MTVPATDPGQPAPSSEEYDASNELVAMTGEADLPLVPLPGRPGTGNSSFHPEEFLRVPRRVIYAQGLLLVLVGLGCFVFGVLAGRRMTTLPDELVQEGPHLLVGQVGYYDAQGRWTPDEGSVVLALPLAERPDEKVSADGLGVDDPLPAALHPALTALGMLGGAYGRADESGRFRLRVPQADNYYFVCISKHAGRHRAEMIEQDILSQLGHFFHDPRALLEDRQYEGVEQAIQGKTEVEVAFRAERRL